MNRCQAFILRLTNPQHDKRLLIDLPVQYMKTTSSEHVVYINCSECQNKNKKQFVYTTCSELVVFMYWTGNSMDNLLSYCGLVDARISTSEKYLPVHKYESNRSTKKRHAYIFVWLAKIPSDVVFIFILMCIIRARIQKGFKSRLWKNKL